MRSRSNHAKVADFPAESSPSCQVWGIDWQRHLPCMLNERIELSILSYGEAKALIKEFLPEVFLSDPAYPFKDSSPDRHKQNYLEQLSEFFVFRDVEQGSRVAGLAIANLQDWSSYYLRSLAIAPAYQAAGIHPLFFGFLCDVLAAHDVRRLEGDVSPTNHHHLHALNKLKGTVLGTLASERWGMLLRIAIYLDPKDSDRFARLFSMTYKSDAKANSLRPSPQEALRAAKGKKRDK